MVIQSKLKNYINKFKLIRITGIATSVALLSLVFLSVFPIINHQEAAEAFDAYPDNVNLTMVVGKESASLDITPTDATGTFASSSTSEVASFDITTNNYTGYTLSISGSDNIGQLSNTATGTTLDTIASATDATTFATGNQADYSNKWGYRPSKLNSVDNTNFLPAPTTIATILDETTTANPTVANNYTIGLGARVDYAKPTGTYTNTYTLTAVANYIAYAITYSDTTGEATDIPPVQSGSVGVASINLSTSEPKRPTYAFAGWCDQVPTASNNYEATACSGNTYAKGASYALNPTANNVKTLYAYWAPISFSAAYIAAGKTTKVGGHYLMQNMDSDICSNVTVGQKEQLTDNRQETSSVTYRTYWVAKLKDNKCWMIQNLRLGAALATTSGTLSLASSNSNIASGKTYTLSNKVASPGYMPKVTDSGSSHGYYDGNAFYCTPTDTNYFVSCYYNWWTSTASTGSSNSTAASGDLPYNICPKGWTLPTGITTTGDFETLYNAYFKSTMAETVASLLVGSAASCTSSGAAPCDNSSGTYLPGFTLNGYYTEFGWYDENRNARYWSRTPYDKVSARSLYMETTFIDPDNLDQKYTAKALRCLAK